MRTNQQRPNGFTGIALFIAGLLAIAVIGILLSSAMERGGWTFIGLVIGLVVVAGLLIGGIAFGMNLFERRSDKRLEALKEDHRHREVMADKHILLTDEGYQPLKQITAPQVQQTQSKTQVDPRHALLVSLCLMTIRAEGYGPTSKRLLSCDDAQDISKNRGGDFSDRDNWDAASKYGQSIGWLYTQIGGSPQEQGLKVKLENGGNTVTDLIDALMKRNTIRDSAVNALPGTVR